MNQDRVSLNSDQPVEFGTWLAEEMERLGPTDYASTLFRDRPYSGQPHTDTGERGQTEIKGITFRDLRDCFIRACFLASGLERDDWPGSVYRLPWQQMDIIAVSQCMACEVEKLMGIYPNVPPLVYGGPDDE